MICISLGFTSLVSAQDSIRLFPKLVQQYDVERELQAHFFHNPASMSDYGKIGFTNLNLGYITENKNRYRQQEGSKNEGFMISVDSYKKSNDKRSIWGSASYENRKIFSTKWNENLDYDRIAPYSIADSAGGNTQLERYQFSGGISQKIKKWTFGLNAGYSAQLGFRNKDPRQKSTTSDLKIDLGINYQVYKNFQAGIFAKLNKYTQNTSVSFVSELGQALVYQMTGFGFSNYFFNGGSPAAIYEELGYTAGAQIFRTTENPFYITASISQSDNLKSVKPTNRYFDISKLEQSKFNVEGAHFFSIHQHRIGVLASYSAVVKLGSEYGYTNNTQIIEQLYKRSSYKNENYLSTFKLFYQLKKNHYQVGVIPYYQYQEITEKRKYPFSGQKFKYAKIGGEVFYKQEIANNQAISWSGNFSKKIVNTAVNALNTDLKQSIIDWLLDDFQYLNQDQISYGTDIRYDVKFRNLPAFFIQCGWQQLSFQQKNNNFVQLTTGITF